MYYLIVDHRRGKMSLRKQILNEIRNIKKLLNETEMSPSEAETNLGTLMGYFSKMNPGDIETSNPKTAQVLLESFYTIFAKAAAGSLSGIKVGNAMQLWQTLPPPKKKAICKIGNPLEGNKYSQPIRMPEGYAGISPESPGTITLCEQDFSPAPTPTGKCPDGSEPIGLNADGTPMCPKTDVPPEEKINVPGCREGSEQSFGSFGRPYGKNGIVGPNQRISQIQQILLKLGYLGNSAMTMGGADREKSLAKPEITGVFDEATGIAVYKFQRDNGGKYASKIQAELGSISMGNPDGCVGAKTMCALLVAYGDPRMSIGKLGNIRYCKQTFGSKNIEAGTLKRESKNWLDKTREETSNSLFERLVKDISKKKVL